MFNAAGDEAAQPRNISAALTSGAAANFGSLLIELENAPDGNSVAAVIDSLVRATEAATAETGEGRTEPTLSAERPRASRKEKGDSLRETRRPEIAGNLDSGSPVMSQTTDLGFGSAPPQEDSSASASPSGAADQPAITAQTAAAEQASPSEAFDTQPEANPVSSAVVPQRSAETNNFSFELNLQLANRQLANRSALQGAKGMQLAGLEQIGLPRSQSLAGKAALETPQKAVRLEIPRDKPAAQSVHKFSVLIRGADQLVRLVVLQNGAQLKVAVHAGSRDLSVHLRESVPELLRNFDNQGYRAQATVAPTAPVSRIAGWGIPDSRQANDFQGPRQHGEQSHRRSQRKALWNLARDLRETSLD